ncbi:C1 family peptidase [Spirosoma sp. SC4-14]|uniref:C1 family peptidase n=1 Tax=Spirosoma sp. SC4-14 TaxID=3128900 RepID=UPI0030D1703A
MKPNTRTTCFGLTLLLSAGLFTSGQSQSTTRKYAGGLKSSRTRSLTVMHKAPLATRSFANLPAEVSYEQFCPTVGDQGKQETSVAFATAYYLRTIMEGKEKNITQKTQLDASRFSPTFVYDKIRDPKDINCQGGGTIEEALDVLKVDGVPRLRTLTYPLCNQAIPPAAAKEATQFRIGDYQQLFTEQADPAQKVQAVKKALAEGNPVVAGIGAPLSFEEARAVWEPAPNEKTTDVLYSQAICVLGYSDKQYGGAFRIVNSWNTGWGEKGFCWIPYSYFGKFIINAFQVYSATNEPGNRPGTVILTSSNKGAGISPADTRKGSAELKLNDGSPMAVSRQATRDLKIVSDESAPTDIQPYHVTQAYDSGTRFKFFLNNSENAYVYALTTQKDGGIEKLFPTDELMSPLLGPNTTIAYPSETSSVVMEKHKGNKADYLLILFARRPLNMEGLLKTLGRKKGSLDKRLTDVLGDQLVKQDQIRYQPDQAAFEVKPGTAGNVVPLLIELKYK